MQTEETIHHDLGQLVSKHPPSKKARKVDDDEEFALLVGNLIDFCAAATLGRDSSHGVDHMSNVRVQALRILQRIWSEEDTIESQNTTENNKVGSGLDEGTMLMHQKQFRNRIRCLVAAAAQFHDIADHKYVADTRDSHSKMNERLKELGFSHKDAELVLDVTELVSYSKERKRRKVLGDLRSHIVFSELDDDGKLVRDIVSDADKLEALGEIGIERCMMVTKERLAREAAPRAADVEECGNESKEHVDELQLLREVADHGEEKLFIMLRDNWIRTSPGRQLAEVPHQVMVDEVCRRLDIHGEHAHATRIREEYDLSRVCNSQSCAK